MLLLNKNIERREVDIMIKIEHLTKKYGEGDSCCLALNDVSADIQENTFTVITGKSGSGKTTLLNMIGLIDKPDLYWLKTGIYWPMVKKTVYDIVGK